MPLENARCWMTNLKSTVPLEVLLSGREARQILRQVRGRAWYKRYNPTCKLRAPAFSSVQARFNPTVSRAWLWGLGPAGYHGVAGAAAGPVQ